MFCARSALDSRKRIMRFPLVVRPASSLEAFGLAWSGRNCECLFIIAHTEREMHANQWSPGLHAHLPRHCLDAPSLRQMDQMDHGCCRPPNTSCRALWNDNETSCGQTGRDRQTERGSSSLNHSSLGHASIDSSVVTPVPVRPSHVQCTR